MKKNIFLAILFPLFCFQFSFSSAKPVNIEVARHVAETLLGKQVVDATPVQFTHIYLFKGADDKGFALIAADNCVRPILAYSSFSTFSFPLPAHVAAWIEGYNHEISALVDAGIEPSSEVQALWENPVRRKNDDGVEPLLTTTWNQEPYYNSLCPYDSIDSAYCITGCVATAMAQIMNYWQWPTVGFASHSYLSTHGILSADFGATTYRWDLMPNSLNAFSDSAAVDAVATLMYHAGVAVDMMYSPTWSGAYSLSNGYLSYPCAENALKTYFRYNTMLQGLSKNFFSDTEWDAILRAELDALHPVYYSGSDENDSGHAFVIDGYDSLGLFHVNWGWGGYYDAFYTIDSLSPGITLGTPYCTYNQYNAAICGIYPSEQTNDTLLTINIASRDSTLGTVLGNGTYHPGDTVTIQMQAEEGCRYVQMASGKHRIPISFLANSNFSDTAIFERIEGDTIGYSDDRNVETWCDDYSHTTEWAIRIPSSMRRGHQIEEVQLYYVVPGDHILNIYQGDSIDTSALVYTKVYSLEGEEGWRTLALDSTLTFNRFQTIWISISKTDTAIKYPLACATYCGNIDGSWYHFPWSWEPYTQHDVNFTWMVRAILDPRDRFHVAASPNDINYGDVTGMGYYTPGDTVTLNALPRNGYQFTSWGNGDTENPLHFVITRDTAFIAYFEPLNGIEDIENTELRIEISGLTITVTLPESIPSAALYDIQGRELSRLTSHVSHFTLPAAGVYLLKSVGCPARKIVITK